MRIGYFDCFSGAAGDMILGAMLDAGLAPRVLEQAVAMLRLPGVALRAERVRRGGLAATHVDVSNETQARTTHRHLPEILRIIGESDFSPAVRAQAERIFRRLAEAEAAVHGIPVEKVHFHEVGAADAIVDVVGACAGLEALGLQRIFCSPLVTGTGTVRCEHGTLPVPAPATAELIRGVPLEPCDERGELLTPTGAAILTTLAESFGPPPAMRVTAIGYGAGARDNAARPNVLRLLVGEQAAERPAGEDNVVVLETNVDDATGQMVGHALARLMEAGALDAYAVPIVMKKGRPGQLLAVLCRAEQADALENLLFAETTTFGVRRFACARSVLQREIVSVPTPFGPIRLKVGRRGDAVLQAWAEYEDCAAAAREHGVALRVVQDAARRVWMAQDAQQHARRDR